MSETTGDPIPTLATWMRDSKRVAVMTGAGASTESPAMGGVSVERVEVL
jgi:hypothetical protein